LPSTYSETKGLDPLTKKSSASVYNTKDSHNYIRGIERRQARREEGQRATEQKKGGRAAKLTDKGEGR